MAERLIEPRRVERRRWPRDPPCEKRPTTALPVLKPLAFSTRSLATECQFRAWKEHVAPILCVSLPEGMSESDGFPADQIAWNLGNMLVVQQTTPAYGFERSVAMLRSSSIDHWHVVVMRSGRSWTEVDGRVAAISPGEVQFGSLGNPFSGRTTPSESLHLYLPSDLFAQSTASVDAMNNTVLSSNAATLLITYLNGVEARLSCLSEHDLPLIVHATRDMILGCLEPSTERYVASTDTINLGLVERARRYVKRNLATEDFSLGDMARALGVSRTRLYQLFERSGGVLHYIQKRRLETAHIALGDPSDTRRIIDIAEAVGFSSAANFSRSFSREFGYSPRKARNATLSNRRLLPPPNAPAEGEPSFDGWLKTLGN